MKHVNHKLQLALVVFISMLGYIVSCTHDNTIPPPPASNAPVITHGTNVHLPGNMTTGNANEWKMDKSHSSVLWSTNYVGASGLLTGRFNQFGIHEVTNAEMINYSTTGQPVKDTGWAFYEDDPSKCYFSGYVQINTSNTGEPGRDTGCNIGNLGTIKVVQGVQNLTVTNLAKIRTTKIEYDKLTTDFIVTMDFTWQGKLAAPLTKSIVGRMKYIPKSRNNNTYDFYGLQVNFKFAT